MDALAPDRLIAGEGTSEARWQSWPGLHGIASCILSELVPAGCRAVVIAPHPDDEVLAFGGLLAMLAAAGRELAVLAVTDGEASHPGSLQWPPDRLSAQRSLESCEGLRLLGAEGGQRVQLRIADGGVSARIGLLASRIGEFIRPGDVLLSTWALDGHPDHEAAAEATTLAAARSGNLHLQAPVWMWHWAAPADSRVPWQRMRRLALTDQVLTRKKRAIAAHETQLVTQDTGTPAVLTPASLARLLRSAEFFILPEDAA